MKPYRQFTAEANQSNHFTEAPASGVEGDYEGEMARSELKSLIANSRALLGMIGQDSEIQAWQQSKITKAADYISAVHNDMVAQEVQEAKGIPNPNTVPGQNPKPVQGDHRRAPSSKSPEDRDRENYMVAVKRWKQGMDDTESKIKELQSTLRRDADRLKEAERRAAKGDYGWGARELWKDSWGF